LPELNAHVAQPDAPDLSAADNPFLSVASPQLRRVRVSMSRSRCARIWSALATALHA